MCSFSLIFSFFISRHGPHLALHSFPTRRSSDLFSYNSFARSGGLLRDHSTGNPECVLSSGARSVTKRPDEAVSPRSEEHTSELQSRQYLVCRLLLEKKNKHNNKSFAHQIIKTHH